MSSAQIPAIYARAIQKYHEITGETLNVTFLTKVQNVEDLTREVDDRNSAFEQFRAKRGAIFNVLESAQTPVQLFGDLASGGAAMVFPPGSFMLDLRGVLTAAGDAKNMITIAYATGQIT